MRIDREHVTGAGRRKEEWLRTGRHQLKVSIHIRSGERGGVLSIDHMKILSTYLQGVQ